jgi:hypothetical protein
MKDLNLKFEESLSPGLIDLNLSELARFGTLAKS